MCTDDAGLHVGHLNYMLKENARLLKEAHCCKMTNLAGLMALMSSGHLAYKGLTLFPPSPTYSFILPVVSLAVYMVYSCALWKLFLNLCLGVKI